MKTLTFSYDPSSRQLSGGDVMAGTTADSGFRICISNHADISGTLQIICGVVVRSGSELVSNPVIDCDGDGIASVTPDIIQATTGTLPISLLVTHDDGTVEASAPTVLMLAVVSGPRTVYSDVLMTRTSDWSWRSAWTYQAGSMALHGRTLYISLKSDNLGHEPSASSEWWAEYYLSPDLIALLSGLTEPIQTALDGIRASVSSEASAREAGDGAVKDAVYTSLSTEAADRQSADGKLREDLDAEISARTAAVSDEATTRASADDALRASISDNATAISAETSARESAVSVEASARAKAVSDEASTRASADSALQTAVNGKVDKITGGSTKRAYTHTGPVQDDTPAVDGTDASSIGLRDANGRMRAADPASGATDKTLVTANWVSQTGDDAPNNLAHRNGNETWKGIKTFISDPTFKNTIRSTTAYAREEAAGKSKFILSIYDLNGILLGGFTFRTEADGKSHIGVYVYDADGTWHGGNLI